MAASCCKVCGAWINLEYGKDSPAEHQDHAGTIEDPRAPGDRDDICDHCDYGKCPSCGQPKDECFCNFEGYGQDAG